MQQEVCTWRPAGQWARVVSLQLASCGPRRPVRLQASPADDSPQAGPRTRLARATIAVSQGKFCERPYSRDVTVVRPCGSVLQRRGDLGVVCTPRVGVEGPVSLVAEVVDAERQAEAPGGQPQARVVHQVVAGTGIGVA